MVAKIAHDKYSNWNKQIWHPKNWSLRKMVHLAKKCPDVICQGLSWGIFKGKFLNLLYNSDSWSWDFKVEFFPLENDMSITLLCLILGVGSISRVFVVLHKVNNVAVRCHFCEIPFMLSAIFARCYFDKQKCPFCDTASVGTINVR